MPESTSRGALTEAVYFILLALTSPLHGYGIMQLVSEYSNNRVNLGSGTLYGALNTLLKKEWIVLVTKDEKGKKIYQITGLGQVILKEEILRLQSLLNCGQNILGGSDDLS